MKKIGYFFFTFLPFFASIGLQFVVMFPLMGFSMLYVCFSGILSGQKLGYTDLVSQLMTIYSNQNFSMVVSIAFAISGILIFGTWYSCQFHGSLQFPADKFSNPKILLGLVLVVPGLQIASAVITGFSAFFLPGWMDFYEKLMETAGFSSASPSLLLILYAVLLGPIEEELTFRGVILASAEKSFPFWAANLFQALLFAIFHLNPIQGIYAFFIGLFLGYVYHRTGSIWISSLLHMLYNGFGTISGMIEIYSPLLMLLLVLISIAGLYLFHKNTSMPGVNHSPDFSDM